MKMSTNFAIPLLCEWELLQPRDRLGSMILFIDSGIGRLFRT